MKEEKNKWWLVWLFRKMLWDGKSVVAVVVRLAVERFFGRAFLVALFLSLFFAPLSRKQSLEIHYLASLILPTLNLL